MWRELHHFFIIFILSGFLIAQDLKYERKSISYADVVLVSDPSIELSQKQANYLIKKLREYIEMPRFDYNPIPEELIQEFKYEIGARESSVSLDEVVEILKLKFVPKIIGILDIEKEMRALNLLTEEQRNSFIATKAKTLGITAEHLLKIMNSAFIYIPVVSQYKEEVDTKSEVFRVTLNAGAIWYRVIYNEDGTSDLKLVVKKETKGLGVAKIGKTFKYEGEKVEYKDFAFRTAATALARDIEVATKEIPEFQLGAQVLEVSSNTVGFSMGKKEGIKIDDGFDLVEIREDPFGETKRVKVGFVRVTRVANNKLNPRALSRAQIIIGSGLEPGVYAIERPRLPFALIIRAFNNPFALSGLEEKMMGYSIQGELLYNLGRNMNISQLWIGAGIFIGSGNPEGLGTINQYFGGSKPSVGITGLNVILMKKFYFKRVAAVGRAELIYEGVAFSKDDYEVDYSSFGVAFGLGVEYVATPDLNLGLNLGYRLFSESESESYSLSNVKGNHSGVVYSVYVNWALPRLGFDPIGLIRGLGGW